MKPFAGVHRAALRAMELSTGQDPDEGFADALPGRLTEADLDAHITERDSYGVERRADLDPAMPLDEVGADPRDVDCGFPLERLLRRRPELVPLVLALGFVLLMLPSFLAGVAPLFTTTR